MTKENNNRAEQSIHGVSLASFLQILEQERKTCTLMVNRAGDSGRLFFHDGHMIDAEFAGESGLEPAYRILGWEKPSFYMTDPEERITRITQPLTHIILTASTRKDEKRGESEESGQSPARNSASAKPPSPGLEAFVSSLKAIPGLKQYYMLNKQGKIIAQSHKDTKLCDFIAYCVVSGLQMKKALDANELHNIRIKLPGDDLLLIIPVGNIIIALMLPHNAPFGEVFAHLRKALAKRKK